MTSVSGPPITHFFPPFGSAEVSRFQQECTAVKRAELDRMFEVAEILFPKGGDHILSTSLYCWPHDPERPRIAPITLETLKRPHPWVRDQKAWWDVYFLPLLSQLNLVRPPWIVRLYLAPDLDFLIPYLQHSRVEVRVMNHASFYTVPGMLWRYLPMDDDVIMMARGTDSLWPDPVVCARVQSMLASPCELFRRFRPIDMNSAGFLVYRSIPGPILTKPALHGGYKEAVKAWIWHQQQGLWPTSVDLPGPDPDEVFEVPKFAMSHWARYGQDEQFLTHWLYYRAAPKGVYTLIDASHSSGMWHKDWAYLNSASQASVLELL